MDRTVYVFLKLNKQLLYTFVNKPRRVTVTSGSFKDAVNQLGTEIAVYAGIIGFFFCATKYEIPYQVHLFWPVYMSSQAYFLKWYI